jgi:hypothetical protein
LSVVLHAFSITPGNAMLQCNNGST